MVWNIVLYSELLLYVFLVCLIVSTWVIVYLCFNIFFFSHGAVLVQSECSLLELVWTVIPSLVVFVLCLGNIYCVSKHGYSGFSYPYVVVGNQWYWSFGGLNGDEYDSFCGDFVNSVEKPMQLLGGSVYRFLVTSLDVVHGFSVPDLGIKIDAIPGRINTPLFYAERLGVFTGYCTELCGAGHGFMPIVVEIVLSK